LAAISGICRQVQGMPLGILLAATWSGVLRPAEIASEIDRDLDFLEADWPDAPRQQRSIRAVFDRSWNLLVERERVVFQALSVFSGGFDRAAAQYVSGASLPELRALAHKSLLQYKPSGRYEIHELLRQYASEKLRVSPGAAMDVPDRHSAFYVAALQRWEADLTGAREPVALAEMETEIGNINVAWAWAVEQGQVERLDRAMEGLEHFFWQSGRYREAEAALQAAASAAATAAREAGDKAACLRVRVRALAWRSNFQRAMGQTDSARRLQEQCLTILQDPALAGEDTRLERAVLSWSRGVTVCMDDYALGKQRFEESYALFRELDHQWGMAWALNASGTMSIFLGNYGDAERRLKEGLGVYQALGYQAGVAGAVSRLAESVWQQGRLEEAARLAREGVSISLQAGNRTESAFALLNLGEVLEKVGEFSEAHSILMQSLERYTDLGHRHYITQAHGLLSSVELHRGRYREACDQARMCLDLARTHGPRFCIGLGHLLLGCLDLVQGVPASAHQRLQEAIAIYGEVGSRDNLSLTLACFALSAREQGHAPEARQHLYQALEIAQGSEAVPPLWWVLLALALVLADEGEDERAVELFALASRYPLVAKSRWFADVAGEHLAAAAGSMQPDRLSVLEERGRTRDLEATVAELLTNLSE
jgi:tetratricopeptide (TPR) repeat protein